MPEPFKNYFDRDLIAKMARHIALHEHVFDAGRFVAIASDGLDDLELKARSAQITRALTATLPSDFPRAAYALVASLRTNPPENFAHWNLTDVGMHGWAIMPMADYIAEHGQGHLAISLEALREMTMRFSSEFAIRPFLHEQPDATLAIMRGWVTHPSHHVRRLVSEGTRPRLPWGMGLPKFVRDPQPILPQLEALMEDPSEYVRRSVANNLNDIAKDHPDVVIEIAERWFGTSTETNRLLKHACRTMLKRGDPAALAIFGLNKLPLTNVELTFAQPHARIGEKLEFTFRADLSRKSRSALRIEYAIDFARPSGRPSRKVFHAVSDHYVHKLIECTRTHDFQDRSIRIHHPGTHTLTVIVNGQPVAERSFELIR